MVNTLIDTFFTVPMFRNVTLRCLTEIGALRNEGEMTPLFLRLLASIQVAQYEDKFIDFFRRTMTQLKTVTNERTSPRERRSMRVFLGHAIDDWFEIGVSSR